MYFPDELWRIIMAFVGDPFPEIYEYWWPKFDIDVRHHILTNRLKNNIISVMKQFTTREAFKSYTLDLTTAAQQYFITGYSRYRKPIKSQYSKFRAIPSFLPVAFDMKVTYCKNCCNTLLGDDGWWCQKCYAGGNFNYIRGMKYISR
jgi:hypothetical protein